MNFNISRQMNNVDWLAQHDYQSSACRLIPLYSFWDN